MNRGIGSASTRKSSGFYHSSTGLKFLAKVSKAEIINFNCDGWRGLFCLFFFLHFLLLLFFLFLRDNWKKVLTKPRWIVLVCGKGGGKLKLMSCLSSFLISVQLLKKSRQVRMNVCRQYINRCVCNSAVVRLANNHSLH